MIKYMVSLVCLLSLNAALIAQEKNIPWIVPPIPGVDKIHISPKIDNSRFIIERNSLKGVANQQGQVLLPPEYTDIKLYPSGWITANQPGKKLLLNAKLENIGLPYERFNPINNGTAVVKIGTLFGLIDMQGLELVPLKYEGWTESKTTINFKRGQEEFTYVKEPDVKDPMIKRVEDAQARSVFPDMIRIQNSMEQKGFLNKNGDTIVPMIYKFGALHPKGYIVASFDGKTWGIIDKNHKTLFPFTAQRFGEWTQSGLIPVRVDNQYGLMRVPSMEMVIPFGTYDVIGTYESKKDLFLVVKNKMNGLIDAKQNILLPLQYGYISQADHITTEISGEGQKRGFYFRPTGFVQEPVYSNEPIHNLMDSLVVATRDTTYALIDSKTGEEVIPFSRFYLVHVGNYFTSIGAYEGKSRYSNQKLVGLYDRKGKLLVPHDSLMIYIVPEDNSFWVCPYKEDAAMMKEQRTADGTVIRSLPKEEDFLKFGFVTHVIKYSEGFRFAYRFFYRDTTGTEQYYQKIGTPTEGLWPVQRNNLWGFSDEHNVLLVDCVFDQVLKSEDGYIPVMYKGNWGVIQNPLVDYFKPFEQAVKMK